MDAIQLLKADHKKVEGLFSDLEALGENAHASRRKIFEQIDHELTVHSTIEEKIFYPALKAKTTKEDEARDEVLEAYEEHANVKEMLKKLETTDPGDETYNAKLQVLRELVTHHVKEEEGEMFPEAQEILGQDELDALGEKLEAAKGSLAAAA